MSSQGPKILAIDEDRAFQASAAQSFNQFGLFYRFVTDRQKTLGGIRQLKPDLLMVRGDVTAELPQFVFEALATDVSLASLPIVLLCDDVQDAIFTAGLRTGVVGMLKMPFKATQHIAELRTLMNEMRLRTGVVAGSGDSTVLARLVEHVRRTRRSGQITFDGRTPREGTATFVLGKLESARFKTTKGVEALVSMVAQPSAQWRFSEVGGGGDGTGVVIEVGQEDGADEEVAVVAGVAVADLPETPPPAPVEDEPLAFEFSLEPTPTIAKAQPAAVAAPKRAQPVRLLLVDDDESLCRMFSTLFTKHGFLVTTAQDGMEGFETALRGEFDTIIADLNMPRMDGWGMLRLLRDDYRTRELPIAFLSCHDDYREQLRAQNAGAQAYFSKGTRLDPLVSQVKKLIAPREATLTQVKSGQPFSVSVATVGPQWLLRELALAQVTGKLDAKDGWAVYELFFIEGRCTHASAVAGRYTADAERAFNAFLASRAAEATFHPGAYDSPASLTLPTEVMIEQGCGTLNENERRVRETLLVTANEMQVNPDLYAVYRQVGPKQWLEVARLICEERVPPRDVIAMLDTSPIEVEETMKDLIRRGVVTLRKA
ncbi:MAG: response regulator [Archangiaceae bacterium]|nr:response regulator [Archangiaceae bacterium]